MIAKQLASALFSVHQAGLVHRNINPSSIFVDGEAGHRHARLLDFHVARPRFSKQTTAFHGDARFAAPEELSEGKPAAETDIYQLGCLLYFALTGHAPFDGPSTADVANAHRFLSPPRVSDEVSRLRRSNLDDLILQMLAKAPSARPSAADVLHELMRSGWRRCRLLLSSTRRSIASSSRWATASTGPPRAAVSFGSRLIATLQSSTSGPLSPRSGQARVA